MKQADALKVGDKVWTFNPSRRRYALGSSAPIYAEHFEQQEIVGETSRSWIVGYTQAKYPKANPVGLYTDKQKADDIYIADNAIRLSRLVRDCKNAAALRKIAEIIGQ
jgi:hypothetical protein